MSAKALKKLVIQLSGSEMKLLRRAALAEGSDADRVAVWAKETLLEAARSHADAPEGQSDAAGTGARPRPKCSCGATNNPNGECDQSCIMRF